MIVELYAKSDVGRVRRGNEDNFLVLDLSTEQTWTGADGTTPPENLTRFDLGDKGLVLVVSDGMGGALAGDVASRMAVDSVREMLIGEGDDACDPDLDLVECLKNATHLRQHSRFISRARKTRVARAWARRSPARRFRGDSLDLVQVGDSRGYVIRKDQIRLATKDQSLVQQLVDVGQISESEAETHMFRNVILQALGAQSEVTPVTGRIRLRQDDLVLLCSDGLVGKTTRGRYSAHRGQQQRRSREGV